MKIKQKMIAILGVSFLFIVLALSAQQMSMYKENQQIASSKNRYLSSRVAKEFADSSASLTRLARTYVSTGDQRYWQQYWDIVKWRGGEIPRPDTVYSGLHIGETIKLKAIMVALNFSKNEMDLLQQANNLSNDLINTETQAMTSVQQGVFAKGPYQPLQDESVQSFAIRILFDANYHREVAKIQQPIGTFFEALEKRTTALLVEASEAPASGRAWQPCYWWRRFSH